jgi:mercuric ion transport protein
MSNRLLGIGVVGTIVAGLCCYTPLLPVVLGGVGLTAMLDILYRDAVLLPILAGFLALTGYAFWRRKR